MIKTIFIAFSILFFSALPAFSQSSEQNYVLNWKEVTQEDPITKLPKSYMVAPDLVHTNMTTLLPEFIVSKEAGSNFIYEISFTQPIYEPFDQKFISAIIKKYKQTSAPLKESFVRQIKSRDINYSVITVPAIFFNDQTKTYQRLKSCTLTFNKKQQLNTALRSIIWKDNSILKGGKFINIRIKSGGIYKIDKTTLEKMGISTNGLDPRTLKLYGMGGGMLPQNSAVPFYNDAEEMAIQVIGEQDGTFDNGDYIIFYHRGPHIWNQSGGKYSHEYNIYSEESGLYLTASAGTGKRMSRVSRASGNGATTVTAYDNLYFYEKELVNLSHSGRIWYGEEFDKVTNHSFNVNIANALNDTCIINSYLAGRTFARSGTPYFNLNVNGISIKDIPISPTAPDYGDPYMMPAYSSSQFLGSGSLNVSYTLEKSSDFTAKGWLNYFEIISRCALNFSGKTIVFRDAKSIGQSDVKYIVANGAGKTLLDITNPLNPQLVDGVTSGNDLIFYDDNSTLKEYVIFENEFNVPDVWFAAQNQNIHNSSPTDLVILTHSRFKNQAERYATYKRGKGLRVTVIEPQTIYNEFSCAVQDVTAIRNYMKMLYDKAINPEDKPKYLLIFGDGSYDFKDRLKNNTNYIPTYQSYDSHTSGSFCNDEYYGTLDDGEGYLEDYVEEGLDVAVGRVPVGNETEAKNMVDKLIHYHSAASIGDWRQYITIIGDDGDNDVHRSQADRVATNIQAAEPGLNIIKLYLDAYEKKIVSGVPAYPEVNDELKRVLDRGCLMVNYSGHGGPSQWAHEKIFDINDIDNLKNYNQLPIFMAATCDFGPYDNPEVLSAGERLILSNKGGAIAYLGTARIANTGQNDPFNRGLFVNNIFEIKNNKYQTIGEAYRKLKVANGSWLRNFFVMGDPSLDLGLPVNEVITTHINTQPVNINGDTIRALASVVIQGEIRDRNNNLLSDFNGTVFPTVFDKAVIYKTLGNDPSSPIVSFTQQKNSIFRGSASVVNGKFTFTFIVPKDINYQWGMGKISYYAYDSKYQAKGFYNKIIIGGTKDTSINDQTGPEINIYLDDEKFAYGGMTNQNPLMILKLKDASGINAVGTGVGRNITATLDNDKTFVVNEYYQSDKDNYQSGIVRYQLVNIEDGKHTLKAKAWDVLNNSSETTTEFTVAQDATLIIKNLLNYPNPFTSNTAFHFDHNRPGDVLSVQVQIMSITGQIVKNLYLDVPTNGSHFDSMQWDGKDDYGDKIGRGVYLYRIKVKTSSGETTEDKGKLVLLN